MDVKDLTEIPSDLRRWKNRGYWTIAFQLLREAPPGLAIPDPLGDESPGKVQRRWHSAAHKRGVKIITRLSPRGTVLYVWEKRD